MTGTSVEDSARTVVLRSVPDTVLLTRRIQPKAFNPDTKSVVPSNPRGVPTGRSGGSLTQQRGLPLAVGTNLDQSYKVIKTIGRGGFAYTYLAENIRNGRLVVIKEAFAINIDRVELIQEARDALLWEVSVIAQIKHTGIVGFENVFEENGTLYYVMDYIEGESLASLLARQGSLSAESVSMIAKSLFEAVSDMHSSDVLHGDIKPGNILVRPNKSVVLIDFGASARLSDPVRRASFVSMGYSPIECYSDQNLGTWSDVYASAATIISAVSGEALPDAVSLMRDSTPIDGALLKSPRPWRGALRQALNPDYRQRTSISELADKMGLSQDGKATNLSDSIDGGSVFISYSRSNNDKVELLVRALQRNGVGVWIDRSGIAPGSPAWGAEIVKGMRGAEACLVFSSEESMASESVKDEIYLARELGKPIIVAKLDGSAFNDDVLMFLTRTQHILAMQIDPSEFSGVVKNALNNLK